MKLAGLILLAGSGSWFPLAAQNSRPAAPAVPPGEWRTPGRDDALTRYSPLHLINRENVAGLTLAWSFPTGTVGPHEGSPLVIGSTLYLHTPWPNQVIAVDLGRPGNPLRWRYRAPAPAPPGGASRGQDAGPAGCCSGATRGLAWHPAGRIYVPMLSGEFAALDAATGREIWRVRNSDWRTGISFSGPPLVAGDLVLVGAAGGPSGSRGSLTAYDAATGRLIWRGWSTGPDREVLIDGTANPAYSSHQGRDLGLATWIGDAWRRGGGEPSGWLSWDPALDLVYSGTGPPAPPNPLARPRDNKWTSSIVARDRSTGRVRWAYQLTPHDQWGYGAASENILADLTIGGVPVRALVHFGRNGFVYTLDRATGRLLTAERFGPVNWASAIDPGSGLPSLDPRYGAPRGTGMTTGICPAPVGMKSGQPAAHSPPSGLFFLPLNNLCMDLAIAPGGFGTVARVTGGPGNVRGRFVAWNAAAAALVWENREQFPVAGGALATAGGLVFYGTLDGWFKAVDQSSGRELWKFSAPAGILGSPITWLGPDGRQYVAVLTGLGGWWTSGADGALPELAGGPTGGSLLVFGL